MPLVAGDGEMEELPPVDHASVDYPAFEKCFYTPHPVRMPAAAGRDLGHGRHLYRGCGAGRRGERRH